MGDSEVLEWKKKFEESETKLSTLKKYAHKAVADYEDLMRKYDQNQKQYEELKQRLVEREEQLAQLQQVLEPVYDEYSQLNMKYEIERGCRDKAEQYATKIVKENKKLKRQSQMLLSQMETVDINIEDVPFDTMSIVSEVSVVEDQHEHYNKIIEDIQNQVVELQRQVLQAEEARSEAEEKERLIQQKYLTEKEAFDRAQTSLRRHETQLQQFKRVSMQALEEYQDLSEKFEMERKLKSQAERYASDMMSQKNAMARESQVLLSTAASDERLVNAMMEIENIQKDLELEKQKHKETASHLEEELKSSRQAREVSELESRLETAVEQIDELNKQIKDQEKFIEKIQKERSEIQGKLDVAEERLKPPPPPIPPPLPPGGFFKPLKALIKKNKPTSNASPNANKKSDVKYQAALEEMMSRIKSGTALRSTGRRPSLPEPSPVMTEKQDGNVSAMNDLHNILKGVKKRSHSVGDLMDTVTETQLNNQEPENELMKTFARIRGLEKQRNLSLIEEVEEKESVSPRSSEESNNNEVTKSSSTSPIKSAVYTRM